MQANAIALGNFFFRHRNWVFPVFLAAIFAFGVPPGRVFGSETLEPVKDAAAVLLAAAGLALRALVIGQRVVRRSGENKTIHADTLFTTGLFSLCRNPLYTGNVLILSGIFLMHGNPYAVVLGIALFLAIYRTMVGAEEDYLHRRFGAPYADYVARVPRWLPSLRRLPAVVGGQPFRISRVLIVEYTNIGLTVLALALLEAYEKVEQPRTGRGLVIIDLMLGIAALALAWLVVMRVLKKTRVLVTPAT